MAADNLMSFCTFKILYQVLENGSLFMIRSPKVTTLLGSISLYRHCEGVPPGDMLQKN